MLNEEELNRYIGKVLRKHRLRIELSQKELGEKLGVKDNTISGIERGTISLDSDKLFKLSALFGIRVDEFFPPADYEKPYLDMAMDLNPETMDVKQMQFLQKLMEKTLSLEEEERERFLESMKFAVDYYDNLNKD